MSQYQRTARHPCDDVTIKVLQCHQQYGKQGEDCVREELSQKKCFAHLLCRREAHSFYDEMSVPSLKNSWMKFSRMESKVSCSTIMELFAKPENEFEIPEGLTKKDRQYCRRITHDLATCLGKKKKSAKGVIWPWEGVKIGLVQYMLYNIFVWAMLATTTIFNLMLFQTIWAMSFFTSFCHVTAAFLTDVSYSFKYFSNLKVDWSNFVSFS